MRLKSLEIKGFKSFANETVIHFGEDVIGIVGPNGSGKSNIVDAIRWVLGEQKSRELRLDTMSSILFNGSKKRKQAGLAKVSLTFDNTKNLLPTEYQMITISRMLYRSGESEYRLNGVPCRLKDITSLFLDTGIGSDSYAIIALNMVDDILADKDNARRKMFEQAAGISKYKIRKRETLNKLKNTSADLERIEDLLFEIENNLKLLEKQARRTKRYFDLKAKYKDFSWQLAILKIGRLKELREEIGGQVRKEEDKCRQLDVEIGQLESKLEAEKKANLDKEKALSERQRELNALVGNIRGMENDKKILEQKAQFIETNRVKLGEQIQSSKGRSMQLEQDIEYYRGHLNEEKRLETELEEQLKEAESVLAAIRKNHGTLKADLDAVVKNQQEVERELFELEKQRAVNNNQIDTYRSNLKHEAEEATRRQTEIEGLQKKIKTLEKETTAKKKHLEKLEKGEEQRQKEVESLEAELELLSKKIQQVNRELDAKRNEFRLTKSMVENLEGFPESIRFLSDQNNWSKNAPLLSDLIYVEEEYRIAIENYLEPYLNYYVVQNLEEAFQAIKLLNKTQKGKANFFLLDAFSGYLSPMQLLPETQRAIDLVKTDATYQNLVSYLLENVLVTESEEVAMEITNDNTVLLSRSGRFIQRKYSLGGGSVGLFEGKRIGRKKNLEILDASIKKAEQKENKLSTEFYHIKSKIESLREQQDRRAIRDETEELNRLAQEKVSLVTRLENLEFNLKTWYNKKEQDETRVVELTTEVERIEEALQHKMNLVSKAREKISNTDGSFQQVAKQLSDASAAFNEKNIEFIRQQNKVSSFQRELSFRGKQLEETKTALTNNQKALEQAALDIRQIQDDADQLEKDLLKSYEQRKQKEGKLTEAEQNYFKARGGINEIEGLIRKIIKTRQDAQILVNNLKDKLTDVRFKLQSVTERMRIEFGIQASELEVRPSDKPETETAKPELSEEELTMQVERLKNRLENYGEVNPMAMEAYDEMKNRHETITTQRDDILKAKEDLLETIKEIEETATTQFLYAFDRTRLFFIDVFRSLFSTEDTADLILLEPANPLESKIEIIAKPKGKRPQTISQLSGGEKTLTAIALLFALYLLKPAPFCIFDEVDAPLDDANIEKFNKIIKKFSKNSQFVIVTHNKQTMAAVDTIYGVFMQEQGVSAVTAVDFRDMKHSAVLEEVSQ